MKVSPRNISVAVTGHRLNQLPETERPRIRTEVSRCLAAVEDAAVKILGARARFTLLSAIAEGADRYAAEAALARSWRLVTPLPFEPARYEEDFPDEESKAQFQRLLWASHRVTPVSEEAAAAIGGRAAHYAAVGRVLIERAEVLLCIWNGKPPNGPGGTSEVAALMLERGGLVLWISAGGGAVRLVGPAPLPRAGSFRRKLHEALAQSFKRCARPPEMRVA